MWKPVFNHIPFTLFFAAVALAAWYGGMFPGLLVAAGGVSAYAVLVRPWGASQSLAAAVVLCVSALVSWLAEQRRQAQWALEAEIANSQRQGAALKQRESDLALTAARLEAERARLHATLEHLPVGVFLAEAENGSIVYGNPQGRSDWNLPSLPVPALGEFEGYGPHGHRLTEEEWPLSRALTQGEVVTGFEIDIFPEGRRRVMRVNSAPVRDAEGTIVGAVVSSDDISVERRSSIHLELLAGASRLLASPADLKAALQSVAELAAGGITEWFSLYLVRPDGAIDLVALAHEDAECLAFAREICARYPIDPQHPAGISQAIAAGVPQLATEVTEEQLRAFTRDESHFELLRQIGARSVAVVPILGREGALGAISLVSSEKRFRLDEADLSVAQDLAARIAVALQLSRLNQETTETLAALRRSEARYRSLTISSAQIVWVTNAQGAIEQEMPGWSAVTGRPVADTMGFGWLDDLHPDDRDRSAAAWEDAHTSGTFYETEYRLRLADGTYRRFAARGTPVRNAEGDILEWVGTCTDIEQAHALEEALRSSEEQFRTLVEQSPLSIQVFDLEGRLLQVNRAWEHLWGVTPEALGDYSLLADPQLDRMGITPYLRRALAGEALELPPVGYAPAETRPDLAVDPEPRWVRAFAYPIRDGAGEIRQAVLIQEDYSDRKRLEDELQQRLEELGEASQHKDQFLSMLAHELRNPLAAVTNALHVLSLAEPGSRAFTRSHEIATRQVVHQKVLVDDLLDVSRINRGKVDLRRESLDLIDLVHLSVEDHRAVCERDGITLEFSAPSVPLPAEIDRTRMTQVVSNLLDNAVKFTPRDGSICVSVTPAMGGNEARISVADTGIGIPPALLPLVFEPFRQAEDTLARSRGGLGLGLALVRGIVELHGGSVFVQSAGEGKGTEFILSVPVHAPPAESGTE